MIYEEVADGARLTHETHEELVAQSMPGSIARRWTTHSWSTWQGIMTFVTRTTTVRNQFVTLPNVFAPKTKPSSCRCLRRRRDRPDEYDTSCQRPFVRHGEHPRFAASCHVGIVSRWRTSRVRRQLG